MNIALIADDGKKELMVQFCIAYCGILAKHELCSTFTTGRLISEATGLKIRSAILCRLSIIEVFVCNFEGYV
jgi:methylglyoxal synthase